MARNKSEKYPRVLDTRSVRFAAMGLRTLYLSQVDASVFRVSISEEQGTTFRDFDAEADAFKAFAAVPSMFSRYSVVFPSRAWEVANAHVPNQGF